MVCFAKGLEYTDLMKLETNPKTRQNLIISSSGKSEAFYFPTSRRYVLLTLARKTRTSILPVQRMGNIHKCSCSYNETVSWKTILVTPGTCSTRLNGLPSIQNIFLSCSADWTIKVLGIRIKTLRFLSFSVFYECCKMTLRGAQRAPRYFAAVSEGTN